MDRNYQRELEKLIQKIEKQEKKPTLFLHCCCAPCSSYVLEYLSQSMKLVLYFYNPNITEGEEYEKRKAELIRLVRENEMESVRELQVIDDEYDNRTFFQMAKGMEQEKEGGKRCFSCYEMRLRKTAEMAARAEADYFCTTLSISPHKNADKLMEIGEKLAIEYDIPYLPSDFKKKNGYKRSIELSKAYGLYRQNYCGCVYSREAARQEGRNECK